MKQKEKLQELLKDQNLKTAQAYQFRLTFQDIFTIKNRHQGATLLKAWLENARTRRPAGFGSRTIATSK
ncbi:transposase (plasmid) [Acidithiobacillus caldus]|uniref:DesA/ISL3 alpha bundle tail domain-containing protein n=1 Tax=Acidithiobacillus caldus TaxID=33059 RepID=UPI000CD350DA|nr:transposase [Acidithiobacillus caldus]